MSGVSEEVELGRSVLPIAWHRPRNPGR